MYKDECGENSTKPIFDVNAEEISHKNHERARHMSIEAIDGKMNQMENKKFVVIVDVAAVGRTRAIIAL